MDLVLTTLNARYAHASLGLRYLRANLGALRDRSVIREFTIAERAIDIVEALLAESPRAIGLGVYIWNARESLEVVRLLRQLAPEVKLVLGGPEVSHELQGSEWLSLADHVITGEGELAFAQVAAKLLERAPAGPKVIPGGLPDVKMLALPYDEYTDEDLAHRVVYVEASRGCPFSCEFCLSSFGRGFDRLLATGVTEIQVGILKRLKGTPIIRHDAAYAVVWAHEPPYELLANALIPFAQLQRLKRFARTWDLISNRGHFTQSVSLLWARSGSAFESVLHFSDWLSGRASLGGIALARLAELFLQYLVEQGHDREAAGLELAKDFARPGQHVPAVLQPWVKTVNAELKKSLPARQARHLAR